TIKEWLNRAIAPADCLMGDWLSTTTRAMLSAKTGIGKTNFLMALGIHAAAGKNFLHWKAVRPARVLFIDGEMSRRLLKRYLADAVRRIGIELETFFAFSHEDFEDFAPLNTPKGQEFVWKLIKRLGGVDLIIFDNIMALTVGDQ